MQQEARPVGTGKELVDNFVYMHRLRRDPRVTPQQQPLVQAKYGELHDAMKALAFAPSAPVAVRENARALVYAATADDDAFEFMPSLLGFDASADEKRRPRRLEEIKARGLEADIEKEAQRLMSTETSGQLGRETMTVEQARARAVDSYFRDLIAPDIEDARKNDYALTAPSGSFLGFGRPQPEMRNVRVGEELGAFPVANTLAEGLEAFQILNTENKIQEDKAGKFLMVNDAVTGEPKRYDIPAHLASLGTEQARAWKDALAGRDPYSMDYARLALGEGVTGRLAKEGLNLGSKAPLVGQALHAINLDYTKGQDFDVDSLVGTVPFVPRITGEKAVDRMLLRDPIAMRMLLETDGEGTFWSTLFGGAVGVADFVATQYALGKVLGVAGKAGKVAGNMLARAPFGPAKMTSTMRRWGADFATRSAGMQWMRGQMVRGGPNSGLHFGTARNFVQEVAYGAVQGVLDPRSTLWSGIASGSHEALVEGVLSPVARNVWRGVGAGARAVRLTDVGEAIAAKLPGIRQLDLRFLDAPTRDRVMRLDATRGGVAVDDLRRAGGKLPSSSPELRELLAKRYKNAEIQQEIANALDVTLVGAATFAHFAAMQATDDPTGDGPGYWAAFQEALLSEDAIASGLGMVAGGLGASGVRRVMGAEPVIVRESGVGSAETLTRDEALNEAAHVMWEALANPLANAERMRLLQQAGRVVADELLANPKAGAPNTASRLYRAVAPSGADGYDRDLRDYLGTGAAKTPFDVSWDQFEVWRQAQGRRTQARPTELGGGQFVEYLNQTRGVTRKDAGFTFSAGEKLALLWGQAGTPGAKALGSMRKAVQSARTVDLVGMARDMMRLPQMFTDLAKGEAGATRKQVLRTFATVKRELERRIKTQGPPAPPGAPPAPATRPPSAPPAAPAPSQPLPAAVAAPPAAGPTQPVGTYARLRPTKGGATWVDVRALAQAAVADPTILTADGMDRIAAQYGITYMQAVDLGIRATDAMLGLDENVRTGPVERGTPESLRGKVIDLAVEAEKDSAVPVEFEQGTQRAMERLSSPDALSAADLDAEAAQDARTTLEGRTPEPPAQAGELLAEAQPVQARLQGGDTSAIADAEVLIDRLRATDAGITAELETMLAETPTPESAEPVAQLQADQAEVQATLDALTQSVEGMPEAARVIGEGEGIARTLEAARELEELGRDETLLGLQLGPELAALGLSLDEARERSLSGTLEAPDWFQRLLRGDDQIQSPEEAAWVLRGVVDPWRGTPEFELAPEAETARILGRYVGRPETVSSERGLTAMQRSAADAAARPLPGTVGPVRDADFKAELQEAALDAAAEEDVPLARALNRQAELAEAVPDAEVEEAVGQVVDPVTPTRYQGDLFDAADPAERAAFEAGGELFGSTTSGVGGWRQSMVTHITAGDGPQGERQRRALVDGAIYASGGSAASFELIDAIFNLQAGSAEQRFGELADLGKTRNQAAIEAALKRVADRTGYALDPKRMRPEMRDAMAVLSLGAPVVTTASGENRIDAKSMAAQLDGLLSAGDPTEAEILERGRRIVLEGWSDRFGKRSGGFLPASAGEQAINQAAAFVVLLSRRMRAVAAGKTRLTQRGLNARIADQVAKKLGSGTKEAKALGGLTAIQFGNLVVEELTGAPPIMAGRQIMRAEARAETAVASTRQAVDSMLEAAAQSRELQVAMRAGDTKKAQAIYKAMAASARSSTSLAEDVAVELSGVAGEDGVPLIDPALQDVTESPELRFWLRVLASPNSKQHARLRSLAAGAGVDDARIDSLAAKAAQIVANHHFILDLAFRGEASQARAASLDARLDDTASMLAGGGEGVAPLGASSEELENSRGQTFYEALVGVLDRRAAGIEAALEEEVPDLNHWETTIGVPLVEKRGDRWVVSEAGIAEAGRLVEDRLRETLERVDGDAEPVYFYAGIGMIAPWLPTWAGTRQFLESREPLHLGYEAATRALDSMGLGFVNTLARIPTEFVGRRTKAVGKGRAERAQDVIGKKHTASERLRAEEFVIETAHVIGDFWAGLPIHLRKAAGYLIESGGWVDVKSSKHLATVLGEAHTPKISRLYDALVDYNWRILELGRRGVMHGFISKEQFSNFTHGALDVRKPVKRDTAARTSYLMTALAPGPDGNQHNQTVNPSNRAQRDGTFSLVGREMARDHAGTIDLARQVFDPLVGLSRSAAQESNQIALYSWLQKAANRWGVPFAELDGRVPKHERRAFMTAAVPLNYTSDRDPVSNRRIAPVQRALADWVRGIRASEGLYRQSGGREGTRPNRRRTAMMNKLVPLDGSPGVAITRHNSADLKFMLEQYATDGDYGSAFGKLIDGWSARWRRTRTVSRVSHIAMSQVSATFANLALGGVTITELVQGTLLNRGPYAESGEAQTLMAQHMEDPTKGYDQHPLAQDYRWFMETIGNTTMVSNLVNNAALVESRSKLERLGGIPVDAVGESGKVANAMARLTAAELATADGIERRLAQFLGRSPSEAEAVVRAGELHTAHYHAAEMLHKFAAFRSLVRRNPGLAATEKGRIALASEAAAATGDYSEVSPLFREWTSRIRNSPIDTAYREGIRGAVANNTMPLVRALFAAPFLGFTTVMMPAAAGAFVRGQGRGALRMATATAFLAGSMMVLSRALGGGDQQERTDELTDAATGTRLRRGGDWTRETSDLWRARNGALMPRTIGPIDMTGSTSRSLERMQHVFLGRAGQGTLMVNAAPNWYGNGALIDTTHYLSATPFEFMLRMAKDVGVGKFAADVKSGNVLETGADMARAMALSDAMQGWTTQHMLGALMAGGGVISSLAGRGTEDQLVRSLEWMRDQVAGDMNPLTAPFSKSAQTWFEATALRGTPIREAVLGMRRGQARELGDARRMAGAGLSMFLPVQEVPARRGMVQRMRSPLDRIRDAIIGERYPAAREVSGFTEDHKAYNKMEPIARRAFDGVVRGIYENSRRMGAMSAPLGVRLGEELRFLTAGVEEVRNGDGSVSMRLRAGYQPQGELAQFVARQKGLEQEYALRSLRDMVEGMTERLPAATTALHRALESNSIDGSVAMRIWSAVVDPQPQRVLEIIAEDMGDPRNHAALSMVWEGVRQDLASELGEGGVKSLPGQRLYLRLEEEFRALGDVDFDAPVSARAADVAPGLLLRW